MISYKIHEKQSITLAMASISSFQTMIVPTVIGMGGAFFLNFGLVETMLLKQTGLVVSLVNATLPLVKAQKQKRIAN